MTRWLRSLLVPLLSLGMAVAAAVLLWPVLGTGPVAHLSWLHWWILMPAFALTEIFVVHLHSEKSAHTHTLREVPSVVALVFLSPSGYLAAYLLGAGVAIVMHAHIRGRKLVFNLAMFALEAALGIALFRLFLGDASPAEPQGWAAAALAALVTDLVSSACVTAALHARRAYSTAGSCARLSDAAPWPRRSTPAWRSSWSCSRSSSPVRFPCWPSS